MADNLEFLNKVYLYDVARDEHLSSVSKNLEIAAGRPMPVAVVEKLVSLGFLVWVESPSSRVLLPKEGMTWESVAAAWTTYQLLWTGDARVPIRGFAGNVVGSFRWYR